MDTYDAVTQCPMCGGSLVYEALGSYGDCYSINKRTGRLCKTKLRHLHYEHDSVMIYCSECGCNFDYKCNPDGTFSLKEYR